MSCATILDTIRQRSDNMASRYRALDAGGSPAATALIASTSNSLNRTFGSTDDDQQFAHFSGWVYAAIRPIAQTIAGLPVRVAKVSRDTKPTRISPARAALPKFLKAVGRDMEVFEDHQLLRMLHEPNPLMVYWHLAYITLTNLELTGRAYWYRSYNTSGEMEIWPLPSHWVSPAHTQEQVFKGWTIRPDGTGEGVEVPPEEVAYFYYPDPSDPTGTISPLWAQMRAVRSDESIQTAQTASFENGIFPGMAVIAGNIIDDDDEGNQGRPLLEEEQRQEIYDAIHRHWGGVAKAGEPLILDALINDVKQITSTIREMDYAGSGKITKSRIMQGFGTNSVVNGELEGANRASSAVARQHFAEFTLNPKVELISQTLTKCVAPWVADANEDIAVWIEPYRPDDREERRKDLDLLAKHGAVSRNELRATLQDLPPIADGDTSLVNANLQPVPIETERAVKQPDPEAVARRDALLDSTATAERWLKNQEKAEKSLAAILVGLFKEQRAAVLASLQEASPDGDITSTADVLLNQRDWHERFMEAILPELATIITQGAMDELVRFEASKAAEVTVEDLLIDLPPDIAQVIREEVATIPTRSYWQDIQLTTRQQLVTTLQEGIAEGESLHELMLRVEDSKIGVLGDEPMTVRASRIARTETTGALNAGHDASMQNLANDGLIEKKEWISTIGGVGQVPDVHERAPTWAGPTPGRASLPTVADQTAWLIYQPLGLVPI